MRIKHLLILSFSFLSFFSCEKGGPKYYYINNEEVKKSVSFKEGSYFIYKDSVTGVIDSIWIYLSQNFMYDDLSTGTHTGDEISVERQEYHLINKDSVMGSVGVRACSFINDCNIYEIRGFPVCQLHFISMTPIFYSTGLGINQKIKNGNGYSLFEKYHDSLLLNGKWRFKVYQIINKGIYHPNPFDSIAVTTYYSLEGGLLKYSVRTDNSYQSWEILNNHIIL